ncbi:MAG: M48 family metallopeptidase [Verrucomicrobiota bacterium]
MLLSFLQNQAAPNAPSLALNGRNIPIVLVRNPRARRYVLRLRPDGAARVTIPRGGSMAEAQRFAERNISWVERQLVRLAANPRSPKEWTLGTTFLLRGESVTLDKAADRSDHVQFGSELLRVNDAETSLRAAVEKHLWHLAARELPPKVFEFAQMHGLTVRRVTVRNQKSRWGSCSRRGTISLNWRLIQAPAFVRDYIILHELMHLRQMNHSVRFWREVEGVCPDYLVAERWLKLNAALLR